MSKEHRELDDAVEILIAHVEWKMEELPRLADEFGLSEDAVAGLKENLQREIDFLNSLPLDATLGSILANHFDSGRQFREGVTGKKEV